jgi:hypothetical protein
VLRVSSMMRIVLDNTDNSGRACTPPTSPHAGAGQRRKSCVLDPNPNPQRRGSALAVPGSNKEARRGSVRGHSAAAKTSEKYVNRHTLPASLLHA